MSLFDLKDILNMKTASRRESFITSGCPKLVWLSSREEVVPFLRTEVNPPPHKFKTLLHSAGTGRSSLEVLRKYPIILHNLKFISQQTYFISFIWNLKLEENAASRLRILMMEGNGNGAQQWREIADGIRMNKFKKMNYKSNFRIFI